MHLEEILEDWERDCERDADATHLADESLKTARLHAKWLRRYIRETLVLRNAENEMAVVRRRRQSWYAGTMTDEELRTAGLRPNPLKLLKTEISEYLAADEEYIRAKTAFDYAEAKVKALDSILRTIAKRGYAIHDAIEWRKFESGG